jgi:hypothetical protein
MTNEREDTPTCSSEGCGKPVDEGSRFCASCGLEWMLLRRDTRGESPARGDRMTR